MRVLVAFDETTPDVRSKTELLRDQITARGVHRVPLLRCDPRIAPKIIG